MGAWKSLAFCAAMATALATAPAFAEDVPIKEEARAHFKAGVALLQDPDGERVEDAYREFKAAYAISASPKILGNIGYCAMRLERDGEAIAAYSQYLRDVPDIDAEERAQISRDVSTMQVGLVKVALSVDQLDARIVDVRTPVKGGPITNAYGPVQGRIEIGVRPGHHTFTAKVASFEDAVWEVDLAAGARESHAFEMKKKQLPPPVVGGAYGGAGAEPRSKPVAAWATLGVGGAMLVAGTVTGILALGKTNEISNKCPNNTCPFDYDLDGNRSSARSLVRVTDVLLIGGGIVAAAGLTWLLLSGGSERAAAKADGFEVKF